MSGNPLGIRRLHHLELLAGNAKQAAYFYRQAFGFTPFAYAGLETGRRDAAGYALRQGRITLLLSTPLAADARAELLRRHGDGVCDIAFEVDDADRAFAEAVQRGARPAVEPRAVADDHGAMRHAAIHTYGDTIHSFYSRAGYSGPFLPGYTAIETTASAD